MAPVVTELRCNAGPKKLFAKFLSEGKKPPIVEGNLIEVSCWWCKDEISKTQGYRPKAVLHRFNVVGDLVETEVIK